MFDSALPAPLRIVRLNPELATVAQSFSPGVREADAPTPCSDSPTDPNHGSSPSLPRESTSSPRFLASHFSAAMQAASLSR
jgi:hypothetical protein